MRERERDRDESRGVKLYLAASQRARDGEASGAGREKKKIRVGGGKRWRRESENSIINAKGRKQKTGGGNKVRWQVTPKGNNVSK